MQSTNPAWLAGADVQGACIYATLPRHARMTRQVEALIAGACLSGTNTRRVKRALAALFGGAVGKDVVSRTWRKLRTDWDAWAKRDLGVSHSESAWAGEGIVRLLRTPEFLITDGGAGLERALAALCPPQPFHTLSRVEPCPAPPGGGNQPGRRR